MPSSPRDTQEDEPDAEEFRPLQSVARFQKIMRIGEGTFGVVYLAKDRETGEHVALKRLTNPEDDPDTEGLGRRELNFLRRLRHPNIVRLKHLVKSDAKSYFLVFEYCEHDLYKLLRAQRYPYRESEIKCILQQILEGVEFLHRKGLMHRDLKTENVLMNKEGRVQLCDFNTMKSVTQKTWQCGMHTPYVSTLSCSAPEMLLMSHDYTEKCDMWGVGCILAELVKCSVLFEETTELGIIRNWAEVLGCPHKAWPLERSFARWICSDEPEMEDAILFQSDFKKLPGAKMLKPFKRTENTISRDFIEISEAGRELLCALLSYNPDLRPSAEEALQHAWFKEDPLPVEPRELPQMTSTIEAAAERQRKETQALVNALSSGQGQNKRLKREATADGVKS